jgi:hypothetical protein
MLELFKSIKVKNKHEALDFTLSSTKKKKREKRKKSLHGSKIDAVICFPFHKWSNKENNDSQ